MLSISAVQVLIRDYNTLHGVFPNALTAAKKSVLPKVVHRDYAQAIVHVFYMYCNTT